MGKFSASSGDDFVIPKTYLEIKRFFFLSIFPQSVMLALLLGKRQFRGRCNSIWWPVLW